MGRPLQPGNTKVDEIDLADLRGRSRPARADGWSILFDWIGPSLRVRWRPGEHAHRAREAAGPPANTEATLVDLAAPATPAARRHEMPNQRRRLRANARISSPAWAVPPDSRMESWSAAAPRV